ncbi:MAG: chaperone NapD [Hyphomicrobiales bacterium]
MREDKLSVISRTRREFLKGGAAGKNHHIASLLVQGWPENIAAIKSKLTKLAGVECHGTSETGKLILTLETRDDAALVETMDRIQTENGVVNVSLVYHHMEAMGDDR